MNNVELIILSSGWLCLLLSNGIAKNRIFVGYFICEIYPCGSYVFYFYMRIYNTYSSLQ